MCLPNLKDAWANLRLFDVQPNYDKGSLAIIWRGCLGRNANFCFSNSAARGGPDGMRKVTGGDLGEGRARMND